MYSLGNMPFILNNLCFKTSKFHQPTQLHTHVYDTRAISIAVLVGPAYPALVGNLC
jgi:hypothetical protein